MLTRLTTLLALAAASTAQIVRVPASLKARHPDGAAVGGYTAVMRDWVNSHPAERDVELDEIFGKVATPVEDVESIVSGKQKRELMTAGDFFEELGNAYDVSDTNTKREFDAGGAQDYLESHGSGKHHHTEDE